MPAPKFTVGLDLGQLRDYTALAVLDALDPGERPKAGQGRFAVTYLDRYPLGTPYPAIVDDVAGLLDREPLSGGARLAIDATGVGVAVLDLFRQAAAWPAVVAHDQHGRPVYAPPGRPKLRAEVVPVTITGGAATTRERGTWRVPKQTLVGGVQVTLQTKRLRVADGLPYAATLVRELETFRYATNLATGHTSYGAGEEWREGQHDDLVLAVAIALWAAERVVRPVARALY